MATLLDIVTKGTTNYSCTIRIADSADGTPETGVVFNTAGIDLWYRRPGAAHTSITEVTQTEAGAHTDGGFVHISDGEYRLDLPDAAVATGVDYVDVGGTVTGMVVFGGRIKLTDFDLVAETPNVNVSSISANAITAASIASGAITSAKFAASAITATAIATDAITATKIASNAITAAKLASNAITAAKIATDAITSAQLSSTAVTKIWAEVCESQGSRSAQQILSILLAAAAGVTEAPGTFKDPAGVNTRIVATLNVSKERTAVALTPSA